MSKNILAIIIILQFVLLQGCLRETNDYQRDYGKSSFYTNESALDELLRYSPSVYVIDPSYDRVELVSVYIPEEKGPITISYRDLDNGVSIIMVQYVAKYDRIKSQSMRIEESGINEYEQYIMAINDKKLSVRRARVADNSQWIVFVEWTQNDVAISMKLSSDEYVDDNYITFLVKHMIQLSDLSWYTSQ